jgi:hypothetical protein
VKPLCETIIIDRYLSPLLRNIPSKTFLSFRGYASFRGEGETGFPLVPACGKVKGRIVQVVLGDFEDEYGAHKDFVKEDAVSISGDVYRKYSYESQT